jgi:hypothetical protein
MSNVSLMLSVRFGRDALNNETRGWLEILKGMTMRPAKAILIDPFACTAAYKVCQERAAQ